MQTQGRTMSELDITTTWGMRLDRTRENALSNCPAAHPRAARIR